MGRYSATERIGVNAVESVTLNEFGWIFREQPISDMGIDAHIESVESKNPTGKLLGVQIKTGKSHFKDKGDTLVYYGQKKHLDYWLAHSLPVILIAHIPESNQSYWANVDKSVISYTNDNWKISIDKSSSFDRTSLERITRIMAGGDREIMIRNLFLHVENMRYIEQGGKLIIYKEEWHNKSLGRGPLNLIKVNSDGTEEVLKEDYLYYTGYDTRRLVEHVYPWASVGIDEQYYSDNFCNSVFDIYPTAGRSPSALYPFRVAFGEISIYRLELKINEVGASFLKLLAYLETGKPGSSDEQL